MQKIRGNSNYLFGTCLILASFIIGIVVGKLFNIHYFKVDQNINIVDVVSVGVTIFAAYIVSKVLDKQKQDNRSEKDLIIKRTEDIYQLIDDSSSKIIRGEIKYQEAASYIKRINVSLSCIYRIINKTIISPDSDLKKSIFANTKKLRDLLTDTPIISESQIQELNIPSDVRESIIHLTHNRIIEIESEYDKLRDNILLLQLTINKS
jgi:hypothetical protein